MTDLATFQSRIAELGPDRSSNPQAAVTLSDAMYSFQAMSQAFGIMFPDAFPHRAELAAACRVLLEAWIPKLDAVSLQQLESRFESRGTGMIDLKPRKQALARERRKLATVASRGARHPEAERPILEDPTDRDSYLPLADWLQGQGDPRGELILADLEGPTSELDGDPRFATHVDHLLGPLADHRTTHDGTERDAFEWRFGFIHRARISHHKYAAPSFTGRAGEILQTLLGHPSGRFLVELGIGFDEDQHERDLQALITVLVKHAPQTLRSLHLGDFEFPAGSDISAFRIGKLGKLWRAVPSLRRLIVQGAAIDFGAIDLPVVEHVEVRTGGLGRASATAIANAQWPAIRHLELWCGSSDYGGTTRCLDLAPLFARDDLRNLERLGLRNAEFTDELCERLPISAIVSGLRAIDLSMGCMTDDGAFALARHVDRLAHLDVIDVSDNYLSDAGLAALAPLGSRIVSGEQKADEGEDERYVSVGE